MSRSGKLFLAAYALLLAALMVAAACDRPAGPTLHNVARATACVKSTADYQYANGILQPANEVLTATTYSCRVGAPWVILIHGGSWINGDRSYTAGAAESFYAAGWQAFNMEYRRGTNISWALQKNDLTAAYRWVVAHAAQFGLDPARGTAYGFSAGGHMAAWLGNLEPLASVVSVSGVLQPQRVADDDNGLRPDTEPTTPAMHNLHTREVDMMGCDYTAAMDADCRAAWDGFDPETALTASSPPVYALQGDTDDVLPAPTIDAYRYWLGQAGVAGSVAVHVPGLGHTPDVLFGDPGRWYTVRQWIAAHW